MYLEFKWTDVDTGVISFVKNEERIMARRSFFLSMKIQVPLYTKTVAIFIENEFSIIFSYTWFMLSSSRT